MFTANLIIICLALFATLQSISASPLPELSPAGTGGFVNLPVAQNHSRALRRRQEFSVPLQNTILSYEVHVAVGKPAQPVTISLDTGSSDIWFYGPGSCSICKGGIYDPSKSTSAVSASHLDPFYIKYFDQTTDQGYFVKDQLQVAGRTVESATLAVATQSTDRGYGILGIGPDNLEAGKKKYAGFLDDLKSQGFIRKHAYSLYLDNLESASGALILGGYDSSKWQGELVTLPIVASTDRLARLNIEWTSISITSGNGATVDYSPSYLPWPAVMDSGYSMSVLGNDLFNQFAKYFGAVPYETLYKVNCDLGTGFVNIGFGNAVTISVPFSELALPNTVDNSGGCFFGFEPAGDNNVVSLGDTVLRSAYVIYDYDAVTISLAQASYDLECSNCAKSF